MAPSRRGPLSRVMLLWHAVVRSVHASGPVVVETSLGKLAGEQTDRGFYVFRGIPYAEPVKRFDYAVPKAPWSPTVLNASAFGARCTTFSLLPGPEPEDESENACFFLNVWSPQGARLGDFRRTSVAPFPVHVFIHGGGFSLGYGSDSSYWGDQLVTQSDPVVHVTFNYRLGVLGFYSSRELGLANFGIRDQLLALQWVHDHIASFGGDPGRVTLSGQSAGAMSTLVHLVSPLSRGLFHRAQIHSMVGLHFRSFAQNAPFVKTVDHLTGCARNDPKDELACLRNASLRRIRSAEVIPEYISHIETACPECFNFLPWMPVVDGQVLPDHPLNLIRSGRHARVPVVLSTVMNETLAFVPPELGGLANATGLFWAAMGLFFHDRAHGLEFHYSHSPDTRLMPHAPRLEVAATDVLFTCYTRYVAGQLARFGNVSLSVFRHAPAHDPGNRAIDPACEHGAACHACNIPFFLPQSLLMQKRDGFSYGPGEERLAHEYAGAFARFAYGKESIWEPYASHTDIATVWESDGPHLQVGYHLSHCNFIESLKFYDPITGQGVGDVAASGGNPSTVPLVI